MLGRRVLAVLLSMLVSTYSFVDMRDVRGHVTGEPKKHIKEHRPISEKEIKHKEMLRVATDFNRVLKFL